MGGGGRGDEDEEKRVERGGQAWLIDTEEGGSEWMTAWHVYMQHEYGGLDSDEADLPAIHHRVLRVLRTLPFIVPFRDRVVLFRRHLAQHRAIQGRRGETEMRVRRSQVVVDGLHAVNHPGNIRVKFVDERTGQDEEGMDIGGPFKELLESLIKEVFRLDYGLFTSTATHTYYPNPAAVELVPHALRTLHSVGRLIGRCIEEGIPVGGGIGRGCPTEASGAGPDVE